MSKTFDLGPVSAYALAVKHGYEGTEEQWVAEMESKRKEAVASAESASESATEAVNSAAASANSASTASTKADEAGNSATRAESYAVGGTGIRQNEDVDNAKYYYQQVKQISGGLSGALAPMGTILFDDLQNQTKQAGYMYNVVDAFTTDETFKEGAGYTYPEGTNVYYTVDGYWDCLAGTVTPAGIGALEVDGDSKDNIVSFTSNDEAEPASWSEVETLASKEKHSSILSKISTMFKNVRYLYKMLGTTDISAIGDGTATGAISAINNNLTKMIQPVTHITLPNTMTYNSDTLGTYCVINNICYVNLWLRGIKVQNHSTSISGLPRAATQAPFTFVGENTKINGIGMVTNTTMMIYGLPTDTADNIAISISYPVISE